VARAQGMRAAAMYVHSFLCGGGSSGRSNDGGGQQQEWRQGGVGVVLCDSASHKANRQKANACSSQLFTLAGPI
jgi:hypothetical protein